MQWLIRVTFNLIGEPISESDDSSLESSGFRNNCTAHLGILVPGGGSSASKPEEKDPVDPVFVRWTTTEPCCVTDDDDPGVKRTKMPCGCVIGKTHKTQADIEASTPFYYPARAHYDNGHALNQSIFQSIFIYFIHSSHDTCIAVSFQCIE